MKNCTKKPIKGYRNIMATKLKVHCNSWKLKIRKRQYQHIQELSQFFNKYKIMNFRLKILSVL